ncbi:MAG: LysR family transcriptional regulator [Rhizobacter sp.]|nr:LysR family transcriptional regulator [Rhizobacter sp.]
MKIENLADLQVLVHTARAGTLTAAAHHLGITPAAASATLKRLEAQLGVRLFERLTRAMRLTPQGETLLDYASRAFELLTEGESMAAADRGALVGTIRLAAPSDLTRSVLLPWLNDFLAAHPGVQLAMSVGDRPLDDARRGRSDHPLRLANRTVRTPRLAAQRPLRPGAGQGAGGVLGGTVCRVKRWKWNQ